MKKHSARDTLNFFRRAEDGLGVNAPEPSDREISSFIRLSTFVDSMVEGTAFLWQGKPYTFDVDGGTYWWGRVIFAFDSEGIANRLHISWSPDRETLDELLKRDEHENV